MSIPTTLTWPDEWAIDPDSFSNQGDFLKALTEKFSEHRDAYYRRYRKHIQDLPHLLTVMITNSWYPDSEIPTADAYKLEELAIANDIGAIDKYLIEYFRANADAIERRACERFPTRAAVINEGFAAFREGRHILAIPVFLAQADGVSEELLKKHFFRSKDSIAEAKELIKDGTLTDLGRLLLDPLVQSGTVRDHTSRLLGKTGYLNRHAIIHGMDQSYGNELNSLKSISLLSYFLLALDITR